MNNSYIVMKSKIFSKMMAVVMLTTVPFLWSSCTDTWGEHYDITDGGMAGQVSLLANIKSDSSLTNFCKVIEAINASDLLDSPQQLTVWAPSNFSEEQADSVIGIYNTDVASGLKWEDNRAITQFLKNHIALYTVTVSSLTNDTIAMLNNKYMHLIGMSNNSGTLQGNPFFDGVLCNNGILYKTENVQTFFPNIREYIEMQSNTDSIVKFISSYDEYELDENSSVAGGVVDGKTIYLDSVTNLKNDILRKYGYIQREDSTYTLLLPTDELWATEYEKYHTYYNYDPSVNNADSLADYFTKISIIRGRFFNTSADWSYNRHPEDSLCNTQYSQRQSHYPRQNVYYHPESGILSGLEKVECSNGYVYIDNKGAIEPQTTFLGRNDIEAYSPRYYEIPKNTNNEETMNVVTMSYETYSDSANSELDKIYYYAQVTAKTSSAQTSLEYTIPETFSGCYYNIYLVTVPDINFSLPLWFQVSQSVKNEKGSFASGTYFNNPHPITEGSVENSEVILKQSKNERCFVASGEKVDTILIQSAVNYTYAGSGLDDGVVKYTIGSFGPSSSKYRETIYTRTLRLNEIILVPFETEEEALAAADDIDAFSDELLEANKEN